MLAFLGTPDLITVLFSAVVMAMCDHNMDNAEIGESSDGSTLTLQTLRFADIIKDEEDMEEVD